MSQSNKSILEKANAAIAAGDYEGFLNHCSDDTIWDFIGEQILEGKEAVRNYISKTYIEPPENIVEKIVAEGDYVTAIGRITMKNEAGEMITASYCDFWTFRDGKLADLKAFVIADKA